MRRALPLNGLASGYICLQCRHRVFALPRNARILHPVSTSSRHYASSGNDESTFSERIRRRLWKTEPPGPEDPYSHEKWDAQKAAKAADRRAKENAIVTNPTGQDSAGEHYVEATTWDGLEQIGGATGWWEEAWDRMNQFEGCVPRAIDAGVIADAGSAVLWRLRRCNRKKISLLPFTVPWLRSTR